jgi:hypothetical protein
MATILNVPITTAVTAQVSPVYQVRAGPGSSNTPASLGVHGNATGTPGTSIQWWLQFSYDDGLTFCDACSFTHTAANRAAGVAACALSPAFCEVLISSLPFCGACLPPLWRPG